MSVNADKPHKAILLIQLEVHGVKENTGECDGITVTSEELLKYGIQPKFTVALNGFDRHECLRKLKEVLDKFETK